MPLPALALAKRARKPALVVALWLLWRKYVVTPASKQIVPWGPRWLAVAASALLHYFGRAFLNYTDNAEDTLKWGIWEDGKQYLMPWHPHGNFTISSLYFISHYWAKNYPGGTPRYVCVAPLLLKIPILAEFLLLCHARSQDISTFSRLLASGATVAVQPGGLREQVATDDKQERVFFPAKLGFIRLALQHGVALLPTYAFGENQLYKTAPWVQRLNQWCYRKLGTGSMIILGQGGIPSSPILPNPIMLPKAGAGLHIRWGKPIDVGPPIQEPSDEQVREVFAVYVEALRRLFDEYKDTLLPPEVAARGLKVMWLGDQPFDEAAVSASASATQQPPRSKI
mmetsp:Transcript_63979/g.166258  ORF Transcript_63979/g.166258 Transcript_63979/m.166258 type:complete len:340 (+) Transcript_63979:45-1064(+)